jgi:cellulose synthase (UDP-forming)
MGPALMLKVLTQPLPLWGRLLRAVSLVLALFAAVMFVTVPMEAAQQAVLTVIGIVVFVIINQFESRGAGLVLAIISVLVTARYLFWRVSDTMVFDSFVRELLCLGLILAETYAGVLLVLAYFQTTLPLNRKPVPLPADPAQWPTVDVYIPTYNESLELVRYTVLAALNLDWPRDKFNVWILDDGRRQQFRAFAEACGCGYIVRPDNKGAKAGNLNHALRHTDGEFIAIFDSDHAPTRAFLQMTVGWLMRDARIALVQTPHYFYSPDPFERNLAYKMPVPNEGLLFYGVIQPGNDLWNAAFFCGSLAVIRRTALEEIGGVPTETVTEDCHCSFRLQQRGWHTAFLRVPLGAGLATERLALHIGQRLRWGRGMIQILRLEKTPFARGLRPIQRLCYFASSFSFLFSLPRLVFLTSPLAFLFFGQNIIAASPLAIIAYAGSHIFHTFATTARMNGPHRHSFWSEIYEAVMAVPLLPVALLALWNPRKGQFNVTSKGGTLARGYLDLRVVAPNVILLILLLAGFVVGIHGVLTTEGLAFQAYLLNTIWCGMCLIPVSASIAVGGEREQSRVWARTQANVPAELVLPDGARIAAHTSDLSLSGARMQIAQPLGTGAGDTVVAAFTVCDEVVEVPSTVLHWEGDTAFLHFHSANLQELSAITRVFFGRPDAWLHWDDWRRDRPLRSLGEVVLSTLIAVFRRHRFTVSRRPVTSAMAAPAPARTSDVVQPRRERSMVAAVRTSALVALLLLGSTAIAGAQHRHSPGHAPAPTTTAPAAPAIPSPAPAIAPVPAAAAATPATNIVSPIPGATASPPAAATASATTAAGEGVRQVKRTLRDLGLGGPMQMRGTSDLQGVLFGIRADEVVTAAKLSVFGGASPALIPSLSQIAVTLNDEAVGTIPLDTAHQKNFGLINFDLDPLFFTEINRLNFRFSGRYAVDCNDALSGLLWATISDLSTITMTIAKIRPQRDLARLPEPFFDRRELQMALNLPFVLPENASTPTIFRAAAIAASWFATLADYRGADFPVNHRVPETGSAVVLAVGEQIPSDVTLPPFAGPTLAVLPNPHDQFGSLLVIGGRTEQDVVTAALALARSIGGLSGTTASVQAEQPPSPAPYVGPNWLSPDQPVRLGTLVDQGALEAHGYAPGPIRIPLRTAPDLYTWRNGGLPVDLRFRAPPGPIVDLATSRLDALVSGTYLRSFPLGHEHSWLVEQLVRWLGLQQNTLQGRTAIPPYLLLGRQELQLNFDMRPLSHGQCAGVPGDIRSNIDPNSTIDISNASRYARMPNLGFFASAGFPFTRLADLSGTAAILPEHPTTAEATAFLNVISMLAAITGTPATGLMVVSPYLLESAGDRDLLVIGALDRQPAFSTLLRDSAVQVTGKRLTLALPGPLQDVRTVFFDAPSRDELGRASLALDGVDEGMGLLLGLESALTSGRSMVAVTGMTPEAVVAAAAALRNPGQSALIRGDVALTQAGRVTAFSTAEGYDVGHLPIWLWAQRWLGYNPIRTGLLLIICALLAAFPIFWILRRRAAIRLRARTPRPS